MPTRKLLVTLGLLLLSSMTRAQTFTDLHHFNCATEGCQPYRPALLAQGRDGNIYGTLYQGGTSNLGTVFEISVSGALTVLYNFDGSTGAFPMGGLTLGLDGNLYGTANMGGIGGVGGYGTIFKITPTGVPTVLHQFAAGTDGSRPMAPPVQAKDGNFYGTTTGGTAYKVSSSGTYKVLTNSSSWLSQAPLMQASDGSFYSTTAASSPLNGTVFKMTTTGALKTIYNFDQVHGLNPLAGLAALRSICTRSTKPLSWNSIPRQSLPVSPKPSARSWTAWKI